MARTTKHTTDVVLEPLDGSGRSFVLFGLQKERVQFKVYSPSRRTAGLVTVTQQRAVGRRIFTLEFSIHEAEGRRPFQSGVYEKGGDVNPTAAEQLELIRRIADYHAKGIQLAYHGLALDVPRCAITDFDADVVYNTGRGTITFEEREVPTLDLDSISIEVAALEEALRLAHPTDTESIEDTDGNLDPEDQLNLTRLLINDHSKSVGPSGYSLLTDPATLATYGLNHLPLVTRDGGVERRILPSKQPGPPTRLYVLPLSFVKGVLPGGTVGFVFNVTIRGLAIRFEFRASGYFSSTWKYHVKLWQTVDGVATDAAPDFTETGGINFLERNIADKLTYSFVGKGGKPLGHAPAQGFGWIKDWALVFADYRGT